MNARTIIRNIALAIVAWMAAGALWVSLTEEDVDPADYPECVELMQYPGTSANAMCSFDGNVIEARNYPGWDY